MQTLNAVTNVPDGIFVKAHEVLNDFTGEVPNYHLQNLEALIVWFRKNLLTPERFNSSKSKGAYRRSSTGVSWFKDTSMEHISKAREIAAILEDIGHPISERTTTRPGKIVFEDAFQIVAEPFADSR